MAKKIIGGDPSCDGENYHKKYGVSNASLKISKLQSDLLEKLEKKFPSSMGLLYKSIGGKEQFLKKKFEEKKLFFSEILWKNGIHVSFNDMGANIDAPVRQDGTFVVGHIGRTSTDTISNFYYTVEVVLPALEKELW